MKNNRVFDRTFWIYVILGLVNYGVCNAIMLVLHLVFHVETDAALYIEFALQTGISFLLNRYVTFRGLKISRWWFPELLTFPFLWQQTEYVLGGGSSHYMFLVLAANQ